MPKLFYVASLSESYRRFNDEDAKSLKKEVYVVPVEQDERVASLKLAAMGVRVDTLTSEQKKYLAGWQEGT